MNFVSKTLSVGVLFLIYAFTHPGNYITHIKKLIHVVETKGPHKTEKYQKKVLQELKTNKTLSLTSQNTIPIITLFSLGETYPLIKNNQETLEYSIRHFWNIRGYVDKTLVPLLQNINDAGNTKGHIYELQRAIALYKAHPNNPILAFNEHQAVTTKKETVLSKEFDIITKKYWIECKDRNFNTKTIDTKKILPLCAQLLAQKRIVKKYNKANNTSIEFQLSSKQPLPQSWKDWLNQENITYTQGIDDTNTVINSK